MTDRLRIGDVVHAVSAAVGEGGRLRIEVDGDAVEARVLASGEGRHVVEVEGAVERIDVVRTPEGTWVWHRGRARLVAPATDARAAPPPGPGGRGPGIAEPAAPPSRGSLPAGAVTPPMPATVVAVLVEQGQAVARGAPLVVVSAMKTEATLTAPVAGRVAVVNARDGARVRPGDVLVLVELAGGPDGG